MKEFRCKFCHRLLAKIGEAKLVEIKCPKCKTLNTWRDDVVYIVAVDERAIGKKVAADRANYELIEN